MFVARNNFTDAMNPDKNDAFAAKKVQEVIDLLHLNGKSIYCWSEK